MGPWNTHRVVLLSLLGPTAGPSLGGVLLRRLLTSMSRYYAPLRLPLLVLVWCSSSLVLQFSGAPALWFSRRRVSPVPCSTVPTFRVLYAGGSLAAAGVSGAPVTPLSSSPLPGLQWLLV